MGGGGGGDGGVVGRGACVCVWRACGLRLGGTQAARHTAREGRTHILPAHSGDGGIGARPLRSGTGQGG